MVGQGNIKGQILSFESVMGKDPLFLDTGTDWDIWGTQSTFSILLFPGMYLSAKQNEKMNTSEGYTFSALT